LSTNDVPENQEDSDRIDWDVLYLDLLGCAVRWFAKEGCSDEDVALPGTAVSARDLASRAILNLLKGAKTHPNLLSEDPFPYALTTMRNDFYDLVKRKEYKRASRIISIDDDQNRRDLENIPGPDNGLAAAEAATLVNSVERLVGHDKMLKAYLEALVVKGVESRADIAEMLGMSVREVTDIHRRLVYKVSRLKHAFADVMRGVRKKV